MLLTILANNVMIAPVVPPPVPERPPVEVKRSFGTTIIYDPEPTPEIGLGSVRIKRQNEEILAVIKTFIQCLD